MTRYALVALAASAFVVAGCGGNGGGEEATPPSGNAEKTFTIKETDYKLSPSTVTVDAAGTYEFKATNDGQTEHALEIEGKGLEKETDTIAPGESATVTVDLQPGTYEMYCPVDGHKGLGMKGEISVAG